MAGLRTILWNSPAALLLGTGFFLGLTFPLGRIASEAGVAPAVWAFVISAGAALVLGIAGLPFHRHGIRFDQPHLRYFMVTALVSYALPNLIVLAAIPHLGSGYVAIMFTLSPLLTLCIASLAGLKQPLRLEIIGLVIAFVGALVVAVMRGRFADGAEPMWIALAFAIPVSLALGNVYRTVDWPAGADLVWLAVGSHTAAALMLGAAAFFTAGLAGWEKLAGVPFVTLLQALSAAAMFALYFRLQAVGGPVTLSQIGAVSAAVGVFAGWLLFNEIYTLAVWAGVAVISLGLALTIMARHSVGRGKASEVSLKTLD